jgi:predicted permease
MTLRRRKQSDFNEEIESHLELEADRLMAEEGLDEKAAREAARRAFGNVLAAEERFYESSRWIWLDSIARDLRYAWRKLAQNPGFAAVAILTLAVGIGAATAIFSVADTVLLRPLPYRDADRLVSVDEIVPKWSHLFPVLPVSAHHFTEWRRECRSFDGIALIGGMPLNLTGAGEPERLAAARVSANLFAMLGISPRLGRNFLESEDQPGRDRVVLISDSLWRRRFAADPSIFGRKIALDGDPYTIIGVLPPNLGPIAPMMFSTIPADIFKPFAITDDEMSPFGDFNYFAIARLKPGVSREQASAELNAVEAGIARTLPEKVDMRAALVPLGDVIARDARRALLLLVAAVGAVLLIICVNVANLLLARTAARRRELAIRVSIGASGGRLLRQMLTESALLAAAGGTLGLAFAYWALDLIVAYAPASLPRVDEIRIDARVLAFAFLVSAAAALASGLLPAWRFARAHPVEALKAGGRAVTEGRAGGRLRATLVGIEAGITTVCLIVAGLLLHSFVRLMQVDKGFAAGRTLTLRLQMPNARYADVADRTALLDRVLNETSTLPGVQFVGFTNKLPLSGEGSNQTLTVEGTTVPPSQRPIGDYRLVSPGYFRALGIPLVAGRLFTRADQNRKLAVISAKTAARLWPGENALGKRFKLETGDSPWFEVAGVVGDVRGTTLEKAPNLTVYIPYWDMSRPSMALVVRTAIDPAAIAQGLRQAIRRIDPELPVPAFQTMDELLASDVSPRRFQLTLVMLFAGAALLLASLGIYGVISYATEQRQSEIGIRMALGGTARDVYALVLRQGLTPVAWGLGAGLTSALALGRVIRSSLFGVGISDAATLASVVALLAAVAIAACCLPARRATRLHPVAVLRLE